MRNEVFDFALAEFAALLGTPNPLGSGTGVRFVSPTKGKATLYHDSIATGNQAELAIELESFSRRMKRTHSQARALVNELRLLTGRDVEPNAQHNWPRVGFATKEHVTQVASAIASHLA